MFLQFLHLLAFLILPSKVKAKCVPPLTAPPVHLCHPSCLHHYQPSACPGVQLAAELLMCEAEWNPAWLPLAVWARQGSQNTYLFVSGNSTAAAQGRRKQICTESPHHYFPQPTTTTLLAQRREDYMSSAEHLRGPAGGNRSRWLPVEIPAALTRQVTWLFMWILQAPARNISKVGH